jgi:hypothetical protein
LKEISDVATTNWLQFVILPGLTEDGKAQDAAVPALASPKKAKTETQHPAIDDWPDGNSTRGICKRLLFEDYHVPELESVS